MTVPATVTVAAGATTASFTATVSSVSTAQSATFTASANGVTETFALQLGAAAPAPTTSSDPVAGYNVYRSPTGGASYQQLNASATTATSYMDSTVQAGQTYDYIVESVDSSGVTSAPSNMASVTIP